MRYSIDGQILTDMADALRSKTSETRTDYFTNSSRTYRYYANEMNVSVQYCWPTNCHHIKLTNINSNLNYDNDSGSWHVKFEWGTSTSYLWSYELVDGYVKTLSNNSAIGNDGYGGWSFKITNSIDCYQNFELNFTANYYDENDNLITCEIWEVVPNTITPESMAATINSMDTISPSLLKLPMNLSYAFYGGCWDNFINAFGDKITTENIVSMPYGFYGTNITKIPFDLNFSTSSSSHSLNNAFANTEFTEAPVLKNVNPGDMANIFYGSSHIREFPDNYAEDWNWSTMISSSNADKKEMFTSCYSLRKLPMAFFKYGNANLSYSYHPLRNFYTLYALDEIVDFPYPHKTTITATSSARNIFYNSFSNISRIKNFTFASDIGTMSWAKMTMDFTTYFGWCNSPSDVLNYNSGIIIDKRVEDDATYQALKNDPDWFTSDVAYSRYNHDSAVATINSLPDCSAYVATVSNGANIIKFKGAAGEKTDGGAINTLTDEEIAVAAAKGWTVTLV